MGGRKGGSERKRACMGFESTCFVVGGFEIERGWGRGEGGERCVWERECKRIMGGRGRASERKRQTRECRQGI